MISQSMVGSSRRYNSKAGNPCRTNSKANNSCLFTLMESHLVLPLLLLKILHLKATVFSLNVFHTSY